MILKYDDRLPKGSRFPVSLPAYTLKAPGDRFGHDAEAGDSVCLRIGKRRRIRRIKRVAFEGACRCNCPRCPDLGTLTVYFE